MITNAMRDSFGRRLGRMFDLFKIESAEITLTTNFVAIVNDDPRRVCILFSQQSGLGQIFYRPKGSSIPNGMQIPNTAQVPFIEFSAEKEFALAQSGWEFKGSAGGEVVVVVQTLYTGV